MVAVVCLFVGAALGKCLFKALLNDMEILTLISELYSSLRKY